MATTSGGVVSGKRRLNPSEHFVAGTLAGLVSTVALFPLDTIKVRYQVDERTSLRSPQRLLGAVRAIVTKEGWQGLYQGLTAGMAGAGLSWGGYFYFYEHAKRRWATPNESAGVSGGSAGALQHMAAACEAGTIMVGLTNPIWLIKTRMQLQLRNAEATPVLSSSSPPPPPAASAATSAPPSEVAASMAHRATPRPSTPLPTATAAPAPAAAAAAVAPSNRTLASPSVAPAARPYRGFLDAILTIVREEGVLALYKGSIPALLLVSHGGVQFVVYERLKQIAASSNTSAGSSSASTAGSPQYLAMGACAKIVASVTTYPFQVIKTRLQQRHVRTHISEEGAARAAGETATTGGIALGRGNGAEEIARPVRRWSAGMIAVGTRAQYKGVVDCVTRTWRQEGVYGFYKGCLPNALRVAPGAALTFYTYEVVADVLRDRAR